MSLPSGGFTSDEIYGDVLLNAGILPVLFRGVVKQCVNNKLAITEAAGSLSAAEKLLRDDVNSGSFTEQSAINRIMDYLRQDATGKWVTRGMWLASGDVTALLTTAWANILKKYS
jgi:hypothetical protein